MPVTMRDVAQHVGVSKQTVSAVLNGKSGISPETIARVRQAIADLGYQPNLVASSLRHGYTNTVGLLLGNVANPFYAEMARGVEYEALARGYSVMLCNTHDDPERRKQYVQTFIRQRVAGVIGATQEEVKQLSSSNPYVCQCIESIDDRRAAYVATAHLLDLGHRRIACVACSDANGNVPSYTRYLGYKAALADWGVAFNPDLVFDAAFDYTSGLRAAEQILRCDPLPTAIFVHQDLTAIGVMVSLMRAGLRIPGDIAIIGVDGLEIAALYNPALTTIFQPVYEMGRRAMQHLADKLEGLPSVQEDPVDCQLIVRESTVPGLHQERISPPIATGTPWNAWRSLEIALSSRGEQ